jgi:hypothetical protein
MRRAVLLLLAVAFAAKLGFDLWSVDRGLDVGDEGFYLINLNQPDIAPPLFEFYRLLARLDPPPRFEIVPTRLLRIAVELLGTVLLTLGAFSWARTRLPGVADVGLAPILLFTGMGALLTVGTRAFGYNDATHLVTCAAVACLFRVAALPAGPAAARARLAWGAASGALVGFQLFVKFPPALLLMASTALGVGLVLRRPAREKLAVLAAHGAGVAAAIGFFAALNGGLEPLLERLRYAAEINRVTGYGVGRILRVYLDHDRPTWVNAFRFAVTFVVALAVARRALAGRRDALDRSLAVALAAGLGVLVVGARATEHPTVDFTLVVLFALLLVSSLVAWVAAWLRSTAPRAERVETLGPPLLLLALPFFEVVGTNVALTLKLPHHAAPIFLMLALLGCGLATVPPRLPRACGLATAALLAVTSALFVRHHVLEPYGLPGPIALQTETVEGLPALAGLKVDPATADFLETLAAEMREAGFEPGDPILALDFMPTLVHALGGRSPAFPFYHFDNPALNCFAIDRMAAGTRPFLILGRGMSYEQDACIEAFDYPDDFVPVATLRNPWERAYPRFFGGPPLPWVHVFAPRR